jgi:serine-type D-Ala-D-Ala carboxypeptidase (penicillin-binding protein 5/6)
VRIRPLLLVGLTALALATPAAATAPPHVTARAYFVQNASTGEVLAAQNARARVPMASITKLMTVLVALDHARPEDVVTVASSADAAGESTVNLTAGEQLTVRDLIKAALIQSANDAAVALASYVGHGDVDTFVRMMNAKAHALGLTETRFVNADGLDAPGHVSSARDVTRLAEVAMHRPEIREVVRERTDTIAGGRRLYTWNDLLGSFPGLVGVKTGHTAAAGWCEVGAARGPGLTIYAAVLGSPTRSERNADLESLLKFGLTAYRVVPVIDAKTVYARAQTGYGRGDLDLVPARTLARAVRVDRPLVERIVAAGAVELPVRRGTPLGFVRVYSGGRLLGQRPLVAARSVSRPGLPGRLTWYAGRTIHHLVGFVS